MAGKRQRRRWALAEAQNWRCAYCTGRMSTDGDRADGATIEHVLPTALGGATRQENLVAACRACNGARGPFPSAAAFGQLRFAWRRVGAWPACAPLPPKEHRCLLTLLGRAEW